MRDTYPLYHLYFSCSEIKILLLKKPVHVLIMCSLEYYWSENLYVKILNQNLEVLFVISVNLWTHITYLIPSVNQNAWYLYVFSKLQMHGWVERVLQLPIRKQGHLSSKVTSYQFDFLAFVPNRSWHPSRTTFQLWLKNIFFFIFKTT